MRESMEGETPEIRGERIPVGFTARGAGCNAECADVVADTESGVAARWWRGDRNTRAQAVVDFGFAMGWTRPQTRPFATYSPQARNRFRRSMAFKALRSINGVRHDLRRDAVPLRNERLKVLPKCLCCGREFGV